jgi:16S rRNA (guanine527-N7)-methyltransferase
MIIRDTFADTFNVSRETMKQFDTYAELLADWQTRMNLVGPSTLPVVWDRHFADSAQLVVLAGYGRSWLDVGAGAGFPGIVVALLDPSARLTLVESITKKCRFLGEVVERLELTERVAIENRRIETLPRQKFDVITARALASLGQLFDWCLVYAGSGTRWLLPKGVRVSDELTTAEQQFTFNYQLMPSKTDGDARIVIATGVSRR